MQHSKHQTLLLVLLIVVLSALPMIHIFLTPDLPHTSDGAMHVVRIAAFYKEVMNGQFPVRWASDLNYGYGTPIFDFFHPLPYILSFPFVLLGLKLVTTFKILLALSFILSGIFMYLFAKEFFKDEKKAFLVTIFYQFAPFRLVEIIVRGSLGSLYSYTILPLVLLGLIQFIRTEKYRWFLFTGVSTALLIMSHNIVGPVFLCLAMLFVLFFGKTARQKIVLFLSLFVGFFLSGYYLFPAILEHKYTLGYEFTKNLFYDHFVQIYKFFIPNFVDIPSLRVAEVSVQFGLFHTIALLLTIYLLFRKRLKMSFEKRVFIYSLIVIGIMIFFMEPITKPLWEHISFLRQFQYPWRLMSAVTLATAFLAVSFFELPIFRDMKIYCLLLFLVIISTVYYWVPPQGYTAVPESYFWNYPSTTNYFGEVDLIWSAGQAKKYPLKKIEVVSGDAFITDFSEKSVTQQFLVHAKTDARLVSNTQFFPGWKVRVDNTSVPIEFQDQHWRGLITFPVIKGQHNVNIHFEQSLIERIGNMVTIVTAVLMLIALPLTRKMGKL